MGVTLESDVVIAFVAVAAVAVVPPTGAWYLWSLFERRRLAAMARFAESRGWSFEAQDKAWTGIAEGEPFGEGWGWKARYVMRGSHAGLPSVVFEYRWVTLLGDFRRTRRAGVYAVALPVDLPSVHIRSERFMDMTRQDLELESEAFNEAFRVWAGDERFAYDLLNARTMEALLASRALIVQIRGRYLVATLDGGLDLEWVDYSLDLLAGMVARLPDLVWTERGETPPEVTTRSA